MNTMKRLVAMLLVLAMALSLAACGAQKQDALQSAQQQEDTLDREDKELIAELIGGQEDASDLTDEELDKIRRFERDVMMRNFERTMRDHGIVDKESADRYLQKCWNDVLDKVKE